MKHPERTVSTPAEVRHLLQSSISEFPLEEFVDLRQEVTDLSVQQVEVLHGLLHPPLTAHLRSATLRTDQLIDASLFNGRREKRLETRMTQETGAVSHRDDLAEGHLVLTDGAAVSQEPEG